MKKKITAKEIKFLSTKNTTLAVNYRCDITVNSSTDYWLGK